MPGPRNYQTEAIIIKKTRLGEADSILTLYTPDLGGVRVEDMVVVTATGAENLNSLPEGLDWR